MKGKHQTEIDKGERVGEDISQMLMRGEWKRRVVRGPSGGKMDG